MKALRSWFSFLALCAGSVSIAIWLSGGTDATPFAVIQSLFTAEKRAKEIPDGLPSDLGGTQDTARQLQRPVPTSSSHQPVQTSYSPLDHTATDEAACSRPRTKSRTDTDSQLVYRWIDEEGNKHLSDQEPEGVIATVLDMSMRKRDFTYKLKPDVFTLPIDFQGQVSAGSKRIYDTWHFFLGEKKLRQSEIEVVLIGDQGRFDAYRGTFPSNAKPVNGFYSMSKNQAVVKYNANELDRTLATTFHEISHLITASHLGPTPPWLTEGLAEYFETMQVKGQTGAIHPNMAHIRLLRESALPNLRHYLSIDRPEWHGEHRDQNYAIAWSLIHFLLKGAPGMYALQEVIQEAEANSCKPYSAAESLDRAYPGGLQRLDKDWRKWLENNRFQTLQT